jgi:hypothetical protein
VPENDKFKDYARYADTCLKIVAVTTDQDHRVDHKRLCWGGGSFADFAVGNRLEGRSKMGPPLVDRRE